MAATASLSSMTPGASHSSHEFMNPKSPGLVWKHLSMQQIYDFNSIGPADEALRYLNTIFKTEPDMDPQRNLILMDFYYYTLRFAKSSNLSPMQASVFFSIMKITHERATASPFIHLESDYHFFRDLLLKHSIHRPPFSQKVFSLQEVKIIEEYALNSYFRHYLMYKYAFTQKLRLNFTLDNDAIEEVAAPAAAAVGGAARRDSVAVESEKEGDGETPDVPQTDSSADLSASSGTIPTTTAATVDDTSPTEPATAPEKDKKPEDASPAPQPTATATAEVEQVVKETEQPQGEDGGEAGAGEAHRPTPQEIATAELSNFISTTLATRIDDLRKSLLAKLQTQEDQINNKLKRLEDRQEEDAGGAGKKGPKGVAGKKK
ncbi:flagellar C1a complex subunit C1a-32-domain-containing protein [Fimicolochytrium jonesii]|uniref:flagellar C1a complex subunit C1a-32-domain-containing protein n=1 Tax=Fimicolochytrium jonesii TaxID=1396493 RepID=UPI0022FE9542|nr:flagellar C1a complex subunit C1a-32-domain-containing protein [Fimicolochytrium jonesii]KAI8818502.1 flagellar C1a complex subunit C1a-32-domain-containing protein [Fimicolochytrium jonesii]